MKLVQVSLVETSLTQRKDIYHLSGIKLKHVNKLLEILDLQRSIKLTKPKPTPLPGIKLSSSDPIQNKWSSPPLDEERHAHYVTGQQWDLLDISPIYVYMLWLMRGHSCHVS
jgi:hypothetical protein